MGCPHRWVGLRLPSRKEEVVRPPKFWMSATPGTCFKAGITVQRWISESSRRFLVDDSSV